MTLAKVILSVLFLTLLSPIVGLFAQKGNIAVRSRPAADAVTERKINALLLRMTLAEKLVAV